MLSVRTPDPVTYGSRLKYFVLVIALLLTRWVTIPVKRHPTVVRIVRNINRRTADLAATLQPDRVFHKPIDAIFEMTNSCNLRCPLCNTGGLREHYAGVERGVMKFTTFRAAFDVLLPEVESIMLYTWGEPLLNRDLFRCIEYASNNKVVSSVSTNMMLYTEAMGEEMIASRLSKLIVSCDGLTQQTYERYRRGGNLATVTRNVKNILSLKESRESRYPRIEMQFVVFSHNEHEVDDYRRFWTEAGVDEVCFIPMSYMSSHGKRVAEEMNLAPQSEAYRPFHPYGHVRQCTDLYKHVTINWNGDWYTCCFPAGMKEYRMGTLLDGSFWDVWNGSQYRYCRSLVRGTVLDGSYCETMCHDCTGCFPRPDTLKYWNAEEERQ